jgi:hypothetical protein
MTNKPLAWNHAIHGESEFWTHKNYSVVKTGAGTYDVMVDGSVVREGYATSAEALHWAHAMILNPLEEL